MSWLPFVIPSLIKDIILISLFITFSLWRADNWSHIYIIRELNRVREIATKYGVFEDDLGIYQHDVETHLSPAPADTEQLKNFAKYVNGLNLFLRIDLMSLQKKYAQMPN